MTDYIPSRGDIIWMNFNPQEGKEQNGHRPALVLTEKVFNKNVGLALVCPITTKPKGFKFEVPLTNTTTTGAVLTHQVRTVDYVERGATFIEKADESVIKTSLGYVGILLK